MGILSSITKLGNSISPWSGAISAGASLIGGALDRHSQKEQQKRQNEFNHQEAELSRQWSTSEREAEQAWQKEMMDYQNEYNSPLKQLERMREAGISPATFQGGAVNESAVPSSVSAPGGATASAAGSPSLPSSGFGAAANAFYQGQMMREQIKSLKLKNDAQELENSAKSWKLPSLLPQDVLGDFAFDAFGYSGQKDFEDAFTATADRPSYNYYQEQRLNSRQQGLQDLIKTAYQRVDLDKSRLDLDILRATKPYVVGKSWTELKQLEEKLAQMKIETESLGYDRDMKKIDKDLLEKYGFKSGDSEWIQTVLRSALIDENALHRAFSALGASLGNGLTGIGEGQFNLLLNLIGSLPQSMSNVARKAKDTADKVNNAVSENSGKARAWLKRNRR